MCDDGVLYVRLGWQKKTTVIHLKGSEPVPMYLQVLSMKQVPDRYIANLQDIFAGEDTTLVEDYTVSCESSACSQRQF